VNAGSGELNTTYLKDKWNSVNHLYEVIAYVKSLFTVDSLDDLQKLSKPDSIPLHLTNDELVSSIAERMADFNDQSISHSREDRNYIHLTPGHEAQNGGESNGGFMGDRARGNDDGLNGHGHQQSMPQQRGAGNRGQGQRDAFKPLFPGFSWRKKVSLE